MVKIRKLLLSKISKLLKTQKYLVKSLSIENDVAGKYPPPVGT